LESARALAAARPQSDGTWVGGKDLNEEEEYQEELEGRRRMGK